MAKHENHASSCDKCELKAPSAPFFNVSDVTLACDDGKRGRGDRKRIVNY